MKGKTKAAVGILPGLVCVLSACVLLFLYAPYELYLSNQLEFWFTAKQLAEPVAVLFVCAFVLMSLCLLAARRLGEHVYTAALALLWLALLCTWIQGSFLIFDLPALNGEEVWWSAYPRDRALSASLWIVLGIVAFLLRKKLGTVRFSRLVLWTSLALCVFLSLTLGGLFLTTDQTEKDRTLICTDMDEFVYSSDENLLILVLDAVDGRAFAQVLERDPSYPEIFEDFTSFTNAMGGYNQTMCSVPLILTGERYEADRNFLEYERQALKDSPLLNRLKEEGYSRRIYETDGPMAASMDENEIPNYVSDQPRFGSLLHSCKLVIKMMLIKHAPWDLKYLGYDLPGRTLEHIAFDRNDAQIFDWTDPVLYKAIKNENPIQVVSEKCFKFLHLEGAHLPHIYDKDLNVVESSSFRDVIEGNIRMVGVFLQRLKEAGVYDNTTIVIMSDHGSSNTTDLATINQHTMLLIKGKNERHPFRTDDAPVSYDDLQEAFFRLLDGAESDEVFPWKAGDARERRFLYYMFDSSILTEYIQRGHAEDMDTFEATGRVLEYKGS